MRQGVLQRTARSVTKPEFDDTGCMVTIYSDAEIEQAARRFQELADQLEPATVTPSPRARGLSTRRNQERETRAGPVTATRTHVCTECFAPLATPRRLRRLRSWARRGLENSRQPLIVSLSAAQSRAGNFPNSHGHLHDC